jgi:hypothetical protein
MIEDLAFLRRDLSENAVSLEMMVCEPSWLAKWPDLSFVHLCFVSSFEMPQPDGIHFNDTAMSREAGENDLVGNFDDSIRSTTMVVLNIGVSTSEYSPRRRLCLAKTSA